MIVALLLLCCAGLFLGNIAAAIWGAYRLTGWWRFAASLPLLAIAAIGCDCLLDIWKDPTSHNLWPFEILLASGLGIGFTLVTWWLQRLWTSNRRPRHP